MQPGRPINCFPPLLTCMFFLLVLWELDRRKETSRLDSVESLSPVSCLQQQGLTFRPWEAAAGKSKKNHCHFYLLISRPVYADSEYHTEHRIIAYSISSRLSCESPTALVHCRYKVANIFGCKMSPWAHMCNTLVSSHGTLLKVCKIFRRWDLAGERGSWRGHEGYRRAWAIIVWLCFQLDLTASRSSEIWDFHRAMCKHQCSGLHSFSRHVFSVVDYLPQTVRWKKLLFP